MAPLAQTMLDVALSVPGLDPAADALHSAVDGTLSAAGPAKQSLKDALNGTWLGHALHPAITDVPVGAWTAAVALDALGEARGARIAIGVGLLGALGAAATGLTDWLDTRNDRQRRLGVVHATLNGVATALYAASWFARGRDPRSGVTLSLAGYALAAVSAMYGGTLALDLQTGTNFTQTSDPPGGEVDVAALADVPDGGMTRVDAGGYPVLLVRCGGDVAAIGAVCAHQGGPLEEGRLDGDVVQCPWHGSRFCVRDGSVVSGPSAYPQPAFAARVANGRVLVAQQPA